MAIRDLLRGGVPDERLEVVEAELAHRYERESVPLESLQADNWLSIPCVVDEEWFVKIVTPQNSLVHALFTAGRNLGAFTSGTEGFFEHFDGPVEMAEHELEATERLREVGVNAPKPIEAFGVDGLGVLVLEYIPDFETLDDRSTASVEALAPSLFEALSLMHDHELAHGDLRAENVLVVDDELVFIDVTNVRAAAIDDARAYDLASALSMLEPLVGARTAVDAAARHYDDDVLLAAGDFVDFLQFRPDHDVDAAALKGEIDRLVSSSPVR
jgi:serine/threonine protein kinase